MAARLKEGEFKGLLGISFPQYGSQMEEEFVRFYDAGSRCVRSGWGLLCQSAWLASS